MNLFPETNAMNHDLIGMRNMTPEELSAKYGNGLRHQQQANLASTAAQQRYASEPPHPANIDASIAIDGPNLDDQLYDILAEGGGNRAETIQRIKALFHAEDAPVLPPETRP